jgi:hypothetical protein
MSGGGFAARNSSAPINIGAGLLQKRGEHYPGVSCKDGALVSRSLRQFFIAGRMSGWRFVSIPSRRRRRPLVQVYY